MPLRINLLAEHHAQEDARRRDPVKRALWIGGFLAIAVLIFSSSLFAKSMYGKSELGRLQTDLNSRTNDYRQILDNKRKLEDSNLKLQALNRLSTNRFLVGNLMNALQQAARPEVQLLHVRIDQSYQHKDEVKAVPVDNIPGHPESSTERIIVMIDARDSSQKPGAAITPYQQALIAQPYFQSSFGKPVDINLKQFGMPQVDADGKVSVSFTLECHIPDRTR